MKKIILPALFAATFFTSCRNDEDDEIKQPARPQQKIGNVIYTLVDSNMVGVTEEHNKASAYLFSGNGDKEIADRRRSVYFIKEGAVITEFHSESDEYRGASINPRPVRQMLDFEFDEYRKARTFYEEYSVFQDNMQEKISKKDSVTTKRTTVKIDSLKGGQK